MVVVVLGVPQVSWLARVASPVLCYLRIASRTTMDRKEEIVFTCTIGFDASGLERQFIACRQPFIDHLSVWRGESPIDAQHSNVNNKWYASWRKFTSMRAIRH
jgi:hypothetical protein